MIEKKIEEEQPMTWIEANNIIARFMGFKIAGSGFRYPKGIETKGYLRAIGYDRSLDKLVPVWEKIGKMNIYEMHIGSKPSFAVKKKAYKIEEKRKTIQEAACVATAKVILEEQKEKRRIARAKRKEEKLREKNLQSE